MSVRYGIAEKTARLFMHKVIEAMMSSEDHSIDGDVDIDEFVIGGNEKGEWVEAIIRRIKRGSLLFN